MAHSQFDEKKITMLKETALYMANVLEGQAGAYNISIYNDKFSNASTGFINYLQANSTFVTPDMTPEQKERAKELREALVEVMASPMVLSSNKILPYGIVSEAMLNALVGEISENRITDMPQCKQWINQAYQVVANYILGYVAYINNNEPKPEIPGLLPTNLFLRINTIISTPDKHTASLIQPIPLPEAKKHTPEKIADIALPDLKEEKNLQLKHQKRIIGFFDQAAKLTDNPLKERTKLMTLVEGKLKKYVNQNELSKKKSEQIDTALKNLLKLK